MMVTPTLPRPLRLPPQPTFETVASERRDSQERLAAAFRLFWKLGYDEGVMGHISFRDPEYSDRFWMNPFGLSFGLVKVSDLLCIDLNGDLIEGEGFPHIGGVPLHSAIYADRPEVKAIAHTHSPEGKAFSTLGRLLESISTEAAVFQGRHAIYDSYTHGEGAALAKAAENNRAVIMQSHGILTLGASVDEAAYLFISLEKVCGEQIKVQAAGGSRTIPDDNAARIAERFGPYNGWLNFQPAYQSIRAEQPDLLQ